MEFTYYFAPDATDIVIFVVLAVIVSGLLMVWWEFYAKPSRDSLAEIARCLHAAPWMDIQNAQRKAGKVA